MEAGRWRWWIAVAAAYPLLLVLAFVLGVAAFWAVNALVELNGSGLEIGTTLVLTLVLFGIAARFVARRGGPHRMWIVPGVGLASYVAYSVATFRGDPITESFPPSLAIATIAAVLLAALVGTVVGEWTGTHRTSAST